MIYYIEGCTCSGKSTLARELVNYYEGFELAPEHTPDHEKMKDLSLPEKQKIIFFDFLNHFETLRQTGKNYICDFSPWGVIPFSAALQKTCERNCADWRQFEDLVFQFKAICMQYFTMNEGDMQIIGFLSLPAEAIQERLKKRDRAGDNMWTPYFIRQLTLEYYTLLSVLKDSHFA